jgi:hypothetical protein
MAITNPFERHPRSLAKLPRVVRLYIFHCLVGFGLSALLTALVIMSNFAGVGSLVATVDDGWLAALVFFVLNGTVLSGVQTSIVIMTMEYHEDGAGGRRPPMDHAAVPVRVRQDPPRQR